MNLPPRTGHPVLDPETLVRWLDLFAQRFNTVPKIGSFTRDISIASGSQSVTGVGTKGGAAFFFAAINGTSAMSFGFDNVTAAFIVGDDNPGGAGTYFLKTTQSIGLKQAVGSLAEGRLTSFDTDGFTLSWNKVGTPTGTATIGYFVFP